MRKILLILLRLADIKCVKTSVIFTSFEESESKWRLKSPRIIVCLLLDDNEQRSCLNSLIKTAGDSLLLSLYGGLYMQMT